MVNAYSLCLCLLAPLLVAALVCRTDAKLRQTYVFLFLGMLACIVSGFISTFVIALAGYSERINAIYIVPFVAEFLKALMLVVWSVCVEPEDERVLGAAAAIGTGFALCSNAVRLLDAPAGDLGYALIYGLESGAISLCATTLFGYLFVSVRGQRRMRVFGTLGALYLVAILSSLFSLFTYAQGYMRLGLLGIPALLAALMIAWQRKWPLRVDRPKLHRLGVGVGAVVLFVFALATAGIVALAWSADAPEKSDVIVVLGYNLNGEETMNSTMEARLERTLQLYHDGYAPCIITSGGAHNRSGYTESAAMTAWLLEHGVPQTALISEYESLTTRQNIAFTQRIMEERGFESVLIVTSGQHLARALNIAFERGMVASGAAAAESMTPLRWFDSLGHEFISWMEYLSNSVL